MKGLTFTSDGRINGSFSPYVDCGKPTLDTAYLKISTRLKLNAYPQELRGVFVSRRNNNGWNMAIVGSTAGADMGKIAVFEAGGTPVMGTTPLQLGRVYDIDIVLQGTNVSIYIDGKLDKTGTLSWQNDNNYKIMLGAIHTDVIHQYRIDGIMYSVKIYSSAGLQLSYDFNNAVGNYVQDLSGNNNNGTIYGAKWTVKSIDEGFDFNGIADFLEFGKTIIPYNSAFRVKTRFSIRTIPPTGVVGVWSEDYDSGSKRLALTVDQFGRITVYQYKNPGGAGMGASTTSRAIYEGRIHEVEYVSDGTVAYLTVDGVPQSMTGTGVDTNGKIVSYASDIANQNNTPTFRIARYRSNFFDGQIYSLKVTAPTGTVVDLDMKKPESGMIVSDLSGNGNNATISGSGNKAIQLLKPLPDINGNNLLPGFLSGKWTFYGTAGSSQSSYALSDSEAILVNPTANFRSTSVIIGGVNEGERYEAGCNYDGGNLGKMWIHFLSNGSLISQISSNEPSFTFTVPSGSGINQIRVMLDNNTTFGTGLSFRFNNPYLALRPTKAVNKAKTPVKLSKNMFEDKGTSSYFSAGGASTNMTSLIQTTERAYGAPVYKATISTDSGDVNFATTINAGGSVGERISIPVEPKTTYTASFYVKSSVASKTRIRMIMWTAGGSSTETNGVDTNIGPDGYSRLSFSFTTASDTAYVSMRGRLGISGGLTNVDYYFAGFQLEKGANLTPYFVPYLQSVPVSNKALPTKGFENIIPPFTEWTLHPNAMAVGAYKVFLDAGGTYRGSSVNITVPKGGIWYTFAARTSDVDDYFQLRFYNADNVAIGSVGYVGLNSSGYGVTSVQSPPETVKLNISYINQNKAGQFYGTNPMLVEGNFNLASFPEENFRTQKKAGDSKSVG